MKELQEHTKHLQHQNDRLRAQVGKRRDLDERDTQDSGQAKHPIILNKGKKPIILGDVDIPTNDELSLDSLPNLSLAKTTRIGPARDTHIALQSAIPVVVRSAVQWAEVRISQTKRPRMHLLYLWVQCYLCNWFTPPSGQCLRSTYRLQQRFEVPMTCSLPP